MIPLWSDSFRILGFICLINMYKYSSKLLISFFFLFQIYETCIWLRRTLQFCYMVGEQSYWKLQLVYKKLHNYVLVPIYEYSNQVLDCSKCYWKNTTTWNLFYGKATNRFLENVSEINFNQCPLSGILKTHVNPLWRSFIDQDATLFADIFISIGSWTFCWNKILNVLLKAYSNHFSVIFLEEMRLSLFVIAILWWSW